MSHEFAKPEAFPPGLGIDPSGAALLPGDAIEKELNQIEFEVLQLDAYIEATHLPHHNEVEANIDDYYPELSTDDSDSYDSDFDDSDEVTIGLPPLGFEDTIETYSYSDGHDWNTAVIGGAVISNLCLVVPDEEAKSFTDLPVAVIQGSMAMHSQLLAPNPKVTSQGKQHELPILLLPGEENISSSLQDWQLSKLTQFPPLATTITSILSTSTERVSVSIETEAAVGSVDDGMKVGRAELTDYVLSGDIKDFFGIKGLKAKLYKYKGPVRTMDESKDEEANKKPEPTREKVNLNPKSYELAGQPLTTLFPFLENDCFKNLPIENLAFTYSEEEESIFSCFSPGLHLEADVLLMDGLQWAGDLLKKLFGHHEPPTSIHLSAHFSNERNWSKQPKINKLVLRGEFRNLTLKPWDFLQFKTIGMELTATQAVGKSSKGKDKEKKSWNFGFGLYGILLITKIPYANAPTYMKYRIARDFVPGKDENEEEAGKGTDNDENEEKDDEVSISEAGKKIAKKDSRKLDQNSSKNAEHGGDSKHKRIWSLVISVDKWEDIYGIKNVTMTEAEIKTSFEEGDFKATLNLQLSAKLALGEGTFNITGKISRDENFINAAIGNLTLSQIKKIHEQISGQKSPREDNKSSLKDEDEAAGHELTFKEINLSLSSTKRKQDETIITALQLDGHVTFNGKASANAKLRIATDGLTIEGGINDFEVPETTVTIKQAGLSIFIGFKQNGNKAIVEGENAGDEVESETNAQKSYDTIVNETIISYFKNMGLKNTQENLEQYRVEIGEEIDKTISKQKKHKESRENESKGGVKGISPETSKENPKNISKKNESKRETKFEILGVIEIEKVIIKIGFHISRKKGQKNYDWIVFGAAEDIILSKIWPSLSGSFLDLQLNSVAFIASSEARGKERKNVISEAEKEEKKTEKDEKKVEGDDEIEKTASWDVLAEIGRYNYPIVEGMQLCATVSQFQELRELNNGEEVDGLVIVVSIAFNGKISIKIEMPSSFAINVGDYAKFGEFSAAISATVQNGPQLELSATLSMMFDDQEPVRVIGVISAGAVTAKGQLYMANDSKWINPFGLSKNVVISALGVATEFEWATVLVRGPSEISIRGEINIGELDAEIVLSTGIGVTKASQVIYLRLSELNIAAIVRLAQDITDNVRLQSMEGNEDVLIFNDLKLYLSTGATLFETWYERGIHVNGKVRFFDKTGDFNGRFSSDGLVISAGLDSFKIGGLEVTSTRADQGVDRATMEIEMTSQTQKVFIDGMIKYYDFELKILIDANLQEKRFNADVSVKFSELLSIALKAVAKVDNTTSLAGILVEFEAELNIDIFAAIFEGIEKGVATLTALATKAIEEVEAGIQRELILDQEKVQKLNNDLRRMKIKSDEHVAIRREKVKAENKEILKARNELDRLESAVRVAKMNCDKHQDKIKAQEAKAGAVKRELDGMLRTKTQEYNEKIGVQRANQLKYERTAKKLIDDKNALFGDKIRDYRNVEEAWNKGQRAIKQLDEYKQHCGKMWLRTGGFERMGWGWKQAAAATQLEVLKAHVGLDTGFRQLQHAVHSLPGFRNIERAIQDAENGINQVGNALEALTTKGVAQFVKEVTEDKEKDRDRQIQTLRDLWDMSRHLENLLYEARDNLNKNKGRLTKAGKNAQDEITKLEAELNLKPFEDEYKYTKLQHERLVNNMKVVQNTLKDVKAVLETGAEITKEVVEMLKRAVPRVTKIYVKASTDVFAKNKPLIFQITAVWNGKESLYSVEWKPGSSPSELYKEVASRLVTGGQPKHKAVSISISIPEAIQFSGAPIGIRRGGLNTSHSRGRRRKSKVRYVQLTSKLIENGFFTMPLVESSENPTSGNYSLAL